MAELDPRWGPKPDVVCVSPEYLAELQQRADLAHLLERYVARRLGLGQHFRDWLHRSARRGDPLASRYDGGLAEVSRML